MASSTNNISSPSSGSSVYVSSGSNFPGQADSSPRNFGKEIARRGQDQRQLEAGVPALTGRDIECPDDCVKMILAFCGEPHVVLVSKQWNKWDVLEADQQTQWKKFEEKFWKNCTTDRASCPLLASYLDAIKTKICFSEEERFDQLYAMMSANLDGETLKKLVFEKPFTDPDLYVALATARKDLEDPSLQRAWPRIRKELWNQGADNLLADNASADDIRKWLDRSNNPDAVLFIQSVRTLDLSDCQLLTIPIEITKFTELRTLNLNRNQLTKLVPGAFSGLKNLQRLALEGNQLTELVRGAFSGLKNLRELYLDANQLTKLVPGVFSHLKNLQRLVLEGNQLTELVRGAFSGLKNLRGLYLDANQLTELERGAFSGLNRLQILKLGGNQLTKLLWRVFSGLENLGDLNLKFNPSSFDHFRQNFVNLSASEKIDCIQQYYVEKELR